MDLALNNLPWFITKKHKMQTTRKEEEEAIRPCLYDAFFIHAIA